MTTDDFSDWEELRDGLRKLRGRNLFRGRESHFPDRGKIVLERERRGEGEPRGEVWIFINPPEGVYAEVYPERKKVFLKDFDQDQERFLSHLLEICRGADYLHTRSEKADYRVSEHGEA